VVAWRRNAEGWQMAVHVRLCRWRWCHLSTLNAAHVGIFFPTVFYFLYFGGCSSNSSGVSMLPPCLTRPCCCNYRFESSDLQPLRLASAQASRRRRRKHGECPHSPFAEPTARNVLLACLPPSLQLPTQHLSAASHQNFAVCCAMCLVYTLFAFCSIGSIFAGLSRLDTQEKAK